MATHVLSSDTLISSLMPSGGGTLASGDTIELSGHDLIIDADAVSYPVTLMNAGATAHLELRDGGRIKLNATLPTSICPWVDPDNPLPESNYTAGLTANASAEIQLNGLFGLGGGPASLPTATRAGNFWALCQSSPDSSHVTFDRIFPLHAGDIIVNAAIQANNANNTCTVLSYDTTTRTAQIDKTGASKTVGQLWFLLAGGVLIHRTTTSGYETVGRLTANTVAGTINFLGYCFGSNTAPSIGVQDCSLVADRIAFKCQNVNTASSVSDSGLLGPGATVIARQLAADPLFAGSYSEKKFLKAGECATWRQQCNSSDSCVIGGGFIYSAKNTIDARNTVVKTASFTEFSVFRLVDSTLGDDGVGDTQFSTSGTVTRVARSAFPVDTDLPDAFYFAPATASDAPWRYEDYWVRKGETLRISCRAMRGGDNGTARIAIGEMGLWVPAGGMPTLAEWTLDSGESLVWHGGQIQWTNDTGEDRQVRVWSMGSGLNGAYIRVWRATGGAM